MIFILAVKILKSPLEMLTVRICLLYGYTSVQQIGQVMTMAVNITESELNGLGLGLLSAVQPGRRLFASGGCQLNHLYRTSWE